MKFVHTGDLHIGKRVNEISMLRDQEYILDEIIKAAKNNSAECILISGDVYDKSVPSADAVRLFDSFLTSVSKNGMSCIVISGNHDCAERISFGAEIMSEQHIYMSKVYDGTINKVELTDNFGKINVYMMPFLRPSNVRCFFEDEEIAAANYNDAISCALKHTSVDTNERNILLAHQFVTSGLQTPETCDSEVFSVGGVDNIDASVFDKFDYVALGHIHRSQRIGRDTIRYCGSPLKYSFSEINHKKSVTLVNVKEKGCVETEQIPLIPLHEMSEIKGSIADILSVEYISEHKINTQDYMHVTLTDKSVTDAMSKVSSVYPNVMQLDFQNESTSSGINTLDKIGQKSEADIFSEFFKIQNDKELSENQKQIMVDIINQCKGEI